MFRAPRGVAAIAAASTRDGEGRSGGDIFSEQFWRTIKYDEICLHDYTKPNEAARIITDCFHFYDFV